MKKIFNIYILCFVCLLQMQAQQIYTLEDCRKKALENNKDILISKEKLNAANSVKKAVRAQYLPNISAKGMYLYNSKNASLFSEDKLLPVGTKMGDGSFGFTPDQISNSWTMINGNAVPLDANNQPFDPKANPEKIEWKNYAYIPKEEFEFDIEHVFVGTITATQPIYLGGKIRQLNKIAETSRKMTESQLDNEMSETVVKIDEAYWKIVSLSAKKQLAESYVKLLETLNNDLEQSIAVGVATKADGLTVKVKLNEAKMTLSQVDNGLNLSKMFLQQLCGLPYGTDFTLVDENKETLAEVNISAPEINMDKAIANRDEVNTLEYAIDIAHANERLQVSRFLPTVAATGGYIFSNPNVFNGVSHSFDGMWNVGVVVNIPIFHWGEKIHTLNAAKSEKIIAKYKLEDVKEKIELQITQATYKTDEANKRQITAKSNVEEAEENLRSANIGFEAGVIPTSNVLEAQTAWLKANAEKIDADIDVKLCDVYLKKAIGEIKAQ